MTEKGIVVHALHKTASMFLYKLFKDLSSEKQISYFSPNNKLPNTMEPNQDINTSFCFCPVRHFRIDEKYGNVSNIFRIFQIRDPRDILVSQYFSYGFIHSEKNWSPEVKEEKKLIQSISIDEYVLLRAVEDAPNIINIKNPIYKDALTALKTTYQPILEISKSNNHNIIIVKYEDMVTEFKSWLLKVIKPFDFFWQPIIFYKYYRKYLGEFSPKKETMTHKRKMYPGDYKEKLKPETIQKLNEIFSDILDVFNYDK